MGGSPLRILVVGAGIAGLAVARALRMAGFRPDVTEKLPPGELADAGLYLPGNAARALRRLDLDGPVRPLGQVIRRQRFLDASGASLCDVDLDALWADVGQCRALLRAELHRVLLTRGRGPSGTAPRSTPSTCYPVSVVVTFVDGTTTEYDLVVGADGPRSRCAAWPVSAVRPAPPAGRLPQRESATVPASRSGPPCSGSAPASSSWPARSG